MRHLWLPILTITLFIPLHPTHALTTYINAPIIGFPESADEEKVSQILDILAKDAQFIDGMAGGLLPATSATINYAGSMDTLSQLLKRLEEGAQLNVLVKFAELKKLSIPTLNLIPLPDRITILKTQDPTLNYHTVQLAPKQAK